MKISTKGRYALRMLIELAENQGEGYLSLKEIADHQNISKKYLEQIIPTLNNSDILKTTRGIQGGYRLAKPASEIKVGDVLRTTEGSLVPVACLELDPIECDRAQNCATLPMWKGLSEVINNYLDSITIQDLLNEQKGPASED